MTTIKLKNGSGAPTAGDLAQGEPALDLTNKRLYTEDSGGTVIEVGTNPGASGAVTLNHSGSAKLATTSTGIDVTGTVTADGLTVEGSDNSIVSRFKATNGIFRILPFETGLGVKVTALNGDESAFETLALQAEDFHFVTGTTERMRIDSSGNVGIGTSSPARPLDVNGAIRVANANAVEWGGANEAIVGDTGGALIYKVGGSEIMRNTSTGLGIGTSSPDGILKATSGSSPNAAQLLIGYNSTSENYFDANTQIFRNGSFAEKMRIDSSGRVGIGVTPFSAGGNGSNLMIGDPATAVGAGLTIGATTTGDIQFGDATTGTGRYAGMLRYQHSDDVMAFWTASTEAMRIDSSGNLLVGKTSLYSTDQGIHLDPDGTVYGTRPNNASGVFNRKTSDGNIVIFEKDGTTVGSIGTAVGYTKITSGDGTNGSGLLFGNSQIYPVEADGVITDDSVSFGDSSNRFKDLYLSGGAYLGGTGSANKLDDYEEGTFTLSSSAGTLTYLYGSGSTYTKIGNRVIIDLGQLQITGVPNNSSVFVLTGLPFSTQGQTSLTVGFVNTQFGTSSANQWFNMYVESNQIYISKRNTSYLLNNSDITGGTYQFSAGGSAYRTT